MKIKSTVVLAVLFIPAVSFAKMDIMKSFKVQYPDSKALHNCKTCHGGMGGPLNSYGADLQKAALDYVSVEALDSDGDTVTNGDEIKANTNPGNKDSHL